MGVNCRGLTRVERTARVEATTQSTGYCDYTVSESVTAVNGEVRTALMARAQSHLIGLVGSPSLSDLLTQVSRPPVPLERCPRSLSYGYSRAWRTLRRL